MLPEPSARCHTCGTQTSWSELEDGEAVVLAAAHALEKSVIGQVLACFVIAFLSASYDVDSLNAALGRALLGVP